MIVGDHPNDKKLAEKLECPFVGVLTGNHSAKDLESNKTQVKMIILNSIQELTKEKIFSLF